MTTSSPALERAAAGLFDAFVAAFAAFDGTRIAELFRAPCVALQADGSLGCLTSQADVARYFQAVLDGYREQGCRSCRYGELSVVPIGTRCALASVTWELCADEGRVVKAWRESYNLHLGNTGAWRIFASADHVP